MPKRKLESEILDVLRVRNKKLIEEVNALKAHLREAENRRFTYEGAVVKAEMDRLTMFEAIRVLAEAISNKTAEGRNARQAARKLLAGARITPPSTLGKARERRSKRRRKPLTADLNNVP